MANSIKYQLDTSNKGCHGLNVNLHKQIYKDNKSYKVLLEFQEDIGLHIKEIHSIDNFVDVS